MRLSLAVLRDAVADGLLAVVLAFLCWGMWQFTSEVTACLVLTSVLVLRWVRPPLTLLAARVHLRLNQWLEWPLWRRVTSVHEAGHILVAHRLGMVVSGYALMPAASAFNQFSGHTRLEESQFAADPERLLDYLTVLMAGKVCEEVVLGYARGASHDLGQFAQWVAVVDALLSGQGRAPLEVAFWQRICEDRARNLLEGQQALIEAIAQGMIDRRSLEQILAIINGRMLQKTCP